MNTNVTITKDKKYAIYVDASNILMSIKGKTYDILSILNFLKDKYKQSEKKYFTGKFFSDVSLYKEIVKLNYNIIYKKIYNENYKVKANCDVEISHNLTFDLLMDKDITDIILVSGDGDFTALVDFALYSKKKIIVYAGDPISCSRLYKIRNDIKLVYLSDLESKFTIEKPPLGTDAV